MFSGGEGKAGIFSRAKMWWRRDRHTNRHCENRGLAVLGAIDGVVVVFIVQPILLLQGVLDCHLSLDLFCCPF